jgi:hypothetical protein
MKINKKIRIIVVSNIIKRLINIKPNIKDFSVDPYFHFDLVFYWKSILESLKK